MTKNQFLAENTAKRQPVQTFTRVMGYITPTARFNVGKKGEFKERTAFTEPCTCSHCGK